VLQFLLQLCPDRIDARVDLGDVGTASDESDGTPKSNADPGGR
jgi:hypothetical protein